METVLSDTMIPILSEVTIAILSICGNGTNMCWPFFRSIMKFGKSTYPYLQFRECSACTQRQFLEMFLWLIWHQCRRDLRNRELSFVCRLWTVLLATCLIIEASICISASKLTICFSFMGKVSKKATGVSALLAWAPVT